MFDVNHVFFNSWKRDTLSIWRTAVGMLGGRSAFGEEGDFYSRIDSVVMYLTFPTSNTLCHYRIINKTSMKSNVAASPIHCIDMSSAISWKLLFLSSNEVTGFISTKSSSGLQQLSEKSRIIAHANTLMSDSLFCTWDLIRWIIQRIKNKLLKILPVNPGVTAIVYQT